VAIATGWHLPPRQAPPWHECPQAPQFVGSESVLVSQPSSAAGAAGAEQLPQPAAQLGAQTPALQSSEVVFALEHCRLQEPQCVMLSCRSVSQPSSAAGAVGVEQLTQPAAQLGAQRRALQASEVAFALEHGRPQAPQFAGSESMFVSQPSSGTGAAGAEQLAQPAAQAGAQAPALQKSTTAFALEHGRPQAPQCSASESMLVSQPSSGTGASGVLQSP
jgi:hypothetical protein